MKVSSNSAVRQSNIVPPSDVVAASAAYAQLNRGNGPILATPELVSLYWGGFAQSEIDGMQAYLNGLAGYLSGQGAPAGQEPDVRQYGVTGATVGTSLFYGPYNYFLLQTGTPITEADGAANFQWVAGDFNHDGIVDLIGIKVSNTGTGRVEVHILNGADNFQSFLLQTGTFINAADGAANYHWVAGDFNHDGIVDLIGIKVTNTGTGTVEAHALIGATNFQGILLETGTPIAEADGASNFQWVAGNFKNGGIVDLALIGIKVTNTGTGMVEAHVLAPGVSDDDVRQLVTELQNQGRLPPFSSNRLFLVFTKGISFTIIKGGGYGSWCGFHDQWDDRQYYAICPFPSVFGCGSGDPISRWQSTASHEIMEAATDPKPGTGWTPEGGDQCNVQEVALPFGTVQKFADNQQQTCSVWTPISGIGSYDLESTADQAFAFDYDGSSKLDHLVLYRPGTGAIFILKNSGGQFTPVYAQGAPGNGIGGYDLKSTADQAFAFDYDGSGKLDHLVLYRPGIGAIFILKNSGGQFTPVYAVS